jgi:hypothetical protein
VRPSPLRIVRIVARATAAVLILSSAMTGTLATAAPLSSDVFLAPTFLANPIPADGVSTTTLRVLALALPADAVPHGLTVTVVRDDRDAALCWFADGGSAAQAPLSDGHADFVITAGTTAGQCRFTASADGAVSGQLALITRVAGTPSRLTVSGNESPREVGSAIIIGVDIDDVHVNLVADDPGTVVSVVLDPPTCTGAEGGPVTADASVVAAVGGRAWFTIRSLGAYGSCAVRFDAAGISGALTAVQFDRGRADHLSCSFQSRTVGTGAITTAAVDLRDVYGNVARLDEPGAFTIDFNRTGGVSTVLVTDGERSTISGAAFFSLEGLSPGIDQYTASLAAISPRTLHVAATSCSVEVIGG